VPICHMRNVYRDGGESAAALFSTSTPKCSRGLLRQRARRNDTVREREGNSAGTGIYDIPIIRTQIRDILHYYSYYYIRHTHTIHITRVGLYIARHIVGAYAIYCRRSKATI